MYQKRAPVSRGAPSALRTARWAQVPEPILRAGGLRGPGPCLSDEAVIRGAGEGVFGPPDVGPLAACRNGGAGLQGRGDAAATAATTEVPDRYAIVPEGDVEHPIAHEGVMDERA